MTVKEELHQLIDRLPEDRLEHARELLDELGGVQLDVDEFPLSQSELDCIARSLEDIKAGRTASFEQVKRKMVFEERRGQVYKRL
jgi:hypothetical protein